MTVVPAQSEEQIVQVRQLFVEYAESLGFSLCFQSFDAELAELPGKYAPPTGRLLLAECEDGVAGCVALRKLEPEICEMKRLYVRPAYRGKGVGRILAEAICREAKEAGYKCIRLDTVEPMMKDAVGLYRRLGFQEIGPYCSNPVEGAMYMELRF